MVTLMQVLNLVPRYQEVVVKDSDLRPIARGIMDGVLNNPGLYSIHSKVHLVKAEGDVLVVILSK